MRSFPWSVKSGPRSYAGRAEDRGWKAQFQRLVLTPKLVQFLSLLMFVSLILLSHETLVPMPLR